MWVCSGTHQAKTFPVQCPRYPCRGVPSLDGISPMSIESKHAYRFGFLKSDEWETLRLTCIAMDEGKCVLCSKYSESNDAHHLFYRERWKDTQVEDLLTLCRECHERVHSLGADVLARKLWERHELDLTRRFKFQRIEGTCACCRQKPTGRLYPVPAPTHSKVAKIPDICLSCLTAFLDAYKKAESAAWKVYEAEKKRIRASCIRKEKAKILKECVLFGVDKESEKRQFLKALKKAAKRIRALSVDNVIRLEYPKASA